MSGSCTRAAPAEYYEALCRRFRWALRALSRGNLLMAPVPRDGIGEPNLLPAFWERHHNAASGRELLALARARAVFVSGDAETGERVELALRKALSAGSAREVLVGELREASANTAEPGLQSIVDMRGGLSEIERAALYLQLTPNGGAPPRAGSHRSFRFSNRGQARAHRRWRCRAAGRRGDAVAERTGLAQVGGRGRVRGGHGDPEGEGRGRSSVRAGRFRRAYPGDP